MVTVDLNWLAVVVSGIASMVLGFLWYGPVFGKAWIRMMGWTPQQIEEGKKQGMTKNYIIALIGTLVLAYVVAHFVALLSIASAAAALQFAFWAWLGLIATVLLGQVLWEGKSWNLFLLNGAYQLANLGMVVLILTFWK